MQGAARRGREAERGQPLRRDAAARGSDHRQRARSSTRCCGPEREANAAYGEGETPLMLAARIGNVEAVTLLLEAGAEANAAEKFRGQTALMLAATENHAPVRARRCSPPAPQVEHPDRRIHVPETDRRRRRDHPRPAAGRDHGADARRAAGRDRRRDRADRRRRRI